MSKKQNTKEVICYNCKKKKGIAKLLIRLIDEKKAITNKRTGKSRQESTGNFKKIFYWEAEGFQTLSPDLFLCKTCERNKRCLRCKILLSNINKCKTCGVYHGAYYKSHPKYCKQCWDDIEASKKT